MSKPPAFQLYAADFYMDTAAWTAWEVGIYFRLLMYEWINSGIPNEIESIARIVGEAVPEKDKRFNRRRNVILCEFDVNFTCNVRKKFNVNDVNNLTNPRLEKEREKQSKYRELQAISGKIGAEKRWKADGVPYGDPNGDPNGESIALQSSSSSTKEIYKEKDFKYNKKVPLPKDIFLTERMKEYVKSQGCDNGNHAEQLFEDFKINHTKRGTKWADWTATFQTWVRNDKKIYNPDKYIKWEKAE